MEKSAFDKTILWLSLLLALLVAIANGTGLLMPEKMYAKESANWYAQSNGQDLIDLFIVLPILILTSLMAWRQNTKALLTWGGVLVYLIYTFAIYSFDIHFNQLFVIYCLALGLSIYLFLWFIFSQHGKMPGDAFNEKKLNRIIAVYMIIIAAVFYLLWLMQIIPANVANTVPKEIADTGLFTNPVHVLDLSVCLPGIMITGILLLRHHRLGLLLTPVILVFFTLMDITIGALIFMMKRRGLEGSNAVAIGMFMLALFSVVLLIFYLKSIEKGT